MSELASESPFMSELASESSIQRPGEASAERSEAVR